ncbi:hypothetical protein DRJ48_02020 [Candidatus Woesearchaeota archaeon]|mgnify:CR=1 FL=1|nr:MAG: hypothetical protein DRJ48_02020 [Candidatus Woesearchaeota archaeon]
MRIIIDTKEDSKEEIQRIAKFLIGLTTGGNSGREFSPEVKEGTFSMFEEEKPKKEPFNINQIIEYD